MLRRFAFLAILLSGSGLAPHAGVLVESIEQGGTAEAVGIVAGDILESWERGGQRGQFDRALDVTNVETTQSPLGRVTLHWRRDGIPLSATMPPDLWRLVVRPNLQGDSLDDYLQAMKLVGSGDYQSAANMLMMAAGESDMDAGPAIWLYTRAGQALGDAGDWPGANSAFQKAFDRATPVGPGSAAAVRVLQGDSHYGNARYVEATDLFQAAVDLLETIEPAGLIMASTLNRLGRALRDRGEFAAAMERFQRTLAIREAIAPVSLPVSSALNNTAFMFIRLGKLDDAQVDVDRSVEIARSIDPECFALGQALLQTSNVYLMKRDVPRAREYQELALAIYKHWKPDSIAVARVLNNMGALASMAGDLDAAEGYHRQTLAIRKRLAPDSLDYAYSHDNLGEVAYRRGDFALAEQYYRQADEIFEHLVPDGFEKASSLFKLGRIARERGDLALAEEYHLRALAIRQRIIPESAQTAASLNSLGEVARARGELAAAREYFVQALPMAEKAEDPLWTSDVLNNLGEVERVDGDLAGAKKHLELALAIKEEHVPDSVDVVVMLESLARLAREQGDLEKAGVLIARAQAIAERDAPESLLLAQVLLESSSIAMQLMDDAAAEPLLRRADALRVHLAPGSMLEAESAAELARLLRRKGDDAAAVALFARAIKALEAQQGRLGGVGDVRTAFRSRHMDVYREQIDLLAGLGRNKEAFDVLERSRARGLLELLAERELVFSADVPAELDTRRRTVGATYDRTRDELARATSEEEKTRLLKQIDALRRERTEIREEILTSSPRLAALQDPEPLNLAGALQAIGQGTALLSYSVAATGTHIFVIDAQGQLEMAVIPIGEQALEASTRRFRATIRETRDPSALDVVTAQGRELFSQLIGPVADRLETAERLLIIPDGPLHLLPFAALVLEEEKKEAGPRYLVEWKPVHLSASVTVYDELRRPAAGRAQGQLTILAFGDPSYPDSMDSVQASDDPVLRTLVERGGGFPPLPASRQEVKAIAGLFRESATAYLGEEATEARAKAAGTDARMIHFAVHGLVDERFPLDSAIALSIPQIIEYGHDNGLLQAWEIFESVRIDADLVTLSACETALGQELAGEGIVGLTRAFHYSGARSVLASLWSVNDISTSELMKRFYGHLKEQLPKDEALRAAQLEMIRGAPVADGDGRERGVKRLAKAGDATNNDRYTLPYYWAAFELFGAPD